MNNNLLVKDKVLIKAYSVIEKCSKLLNIELISVVLFGSRVKKPNSSQSEYEILVLVDEDAGLTGYIRFSETLKIHLLSEKLYNVKFLMYTPSVFENILYDDNIVGTFLYIVLRENIILYDKMNIFYKMRERMISGVLKSEEVFIKQCIEFCRMMSSEKWENRWEKKLMQYKYLKNKKD